MGDEFWQYRPAMPGDEARAIDWRRSARSDAHFVREKEWQAAQSVLLWVDVAQSMGFSSDKNLPAKGDRARLLALAAAILLIRGGERVALAALGTPARGGEVQLMRIAQGLSAEVGPDRETLLVHALDAPDEQEAIDFIKRRYEAPIREIFE